jgi:spermidine synthase
MLNGCFMLTEKDAFVYHEMLTHPALQILPEARNALVVGGGDGGAVSQIVKYSGVESIVLCEIDSVVVESCKTHLPDISSGLNDPRVDIRIEDGAAYVKDNPGTFDLILVDSTDPVGPAKVLFEPPFFESVKLGLKPGGIAVFQTESPMFMLDTFVEAVAKLAQVFGKDCAFPYFSTVPCYPGGLWSFTLCSDAHNPITEAPEQMDDTLLDELEYYNAAVHRAAFAAPGFVLKALAGNS